MGHTPRKRSDVKTRFVLHLDADLAQRLWAHCRAARIEPGSWVRAIAAARCHLKGAQVQCLVQMPPVKQDKFGAVRLGVPCSEREAQAIWERTRSDGAGSTSAWLTREVARALRGTPTPQLPN